MTIRIKIILISVMILFAAMGVNTLVTTTYFADEYLAARKSETFVIARTLKSQMDRLLKLHIPLSQLVGFEKMCREAVAENQHITYAMVVDPDGKILFHNDPTRHGLEITDAAVLNALGKKHLQKTLIGNETVYDFFFTGFTK